MEPHFLTGGAPIVRAPLQVQLGRAARRRMRAIAGAQAVSQAGMVQTVNAEAICLTPYYDSNHVLTIDIGHTAAAGAPVPHLPWLGPPHTIGQAIFNFENDIAKYEVGVRRAFTRALTQWQFDAAFDFNYNAGAIEVAQWVKLWNAGQDAAAEQSFLANWKQPASRRAIERALFFHGQYAADQGAALVPANDRGLLNWGAATRVHVQSYFPARVA